jgi:alkanesulfonate monooxygenase SsuD/methylene tetrahydromethanopterin reductase-like flavin-dependent oxidoreductase (luciferase family)
LLAKQAAEVDILRRFRLGLGVGWNAVEYEALGQDFTTRGRRQAEQIGLLRQLWTQRSVTHEGYFDRVRGAGLAPLPVQRPIPIWLGGHAVAAYRRIGTLADGWFPQVRPGPSLDEARRVIAQAAIDVGRDPERIGMEGRVTYGGSMDDLLEQVDRWEEARASHVTVNTMGSGLNGLDGHVEVLTSMAKVLQLA